MTFGEVGDLLEQEVHCYFEPGSSSGAQREECELGVFKAERIWLHS